MGIIPIALTILAIASGYIGYLVGKYECKSLENTISILANRVRQMDREAKKAKKEHYLTYHLPTHNEKKRIMKKKELNLVEILKDCPKGTKLYCTVYGVVEFQEINNSDKSYPIIIRAFKYDGGSLNDSIASDGKLWLGHNGECTLFPSKENRDWSTFNVEKPKFDPSTLQPFDKVLVRNNNSEYWSTGLYSHKANLVFPYICVGCCYTQCIPYNEETKHLLGTADEAPEFYQV